MENLKLETEIQQELNCMTLRSLASVDLTVPSTNQKNTVQEFFLLMAICNTVVVSLHAHEDPVRFRIKFQRINKFYPSIFIAGNYLSIWKRVFCSFGVLYIFFLSSKQGEESHIRATFSPKLLPDSTKNFANCDLYNFDARITTNEPAHEIIVLIT